jgi:hypothetical protein
MTKPKVLFILDKWCEGKISLGISEWETNLWKSLECTNLADVRTFHFDDMSDSDKDFELVQSCIEDQPDLICLVLYKEPGYDSSVLSYNSLDKLKEMKIPIFSIWGDLQNEPQRELAQKLSPYVELNVYTAAKDVIADIKDKSKFKYLWVPKDERVFKEYSLKKSIPVAYIGTKKYDRMGFINSLSFPVYCEGGERAVHLSTEDYARMLNCVKISLSFSVASNTNVVNARAFETMHCGAMLLEQYGKELEYFYTPFEDYVPYYNKKDLEEKVKFYLEHEEERNRIATNGMNKTKSLYSATKFWNIVLGDLL